jgi:cytochrome P450
MEQITKILIFERFLSILAIYAEEGSEFDIYPLLSAITMDFVTSYLFGLGANADLLRDEQQRARFLKLYHNRHSHTFYLQELPRLTSFLERIRLRLVPTWVPEANAEIESWTMKMCGRANQMYSSTANIGGTCEEIANEPVVYRQFRSALERSNPLEQRYSQDLQSSSRGQLTVASEMLDHLAAGFDTSGITLVYVIHELSQRPKLQEALRTELSTLSPSMKIMEEENHELPSSRELDALPLLQAIIQETLRLRSAIPGPQPRITPKEGCILGPLGEYKVPGGIRVSAQAHSLHRSPEIYEDPEKWSPERWLKPSDDAHLREMNRQFWAFGSGGRMCIGSNFAMYRGCTLKSM